MSKKGFIAIAMFCIAAGAHAVTPVESQQKEHQKSHNVIFFGEGEKPDSTAIWQTINNFYIDQFRHYQDPRAPYFMFMSKSRNFAMGIGGAVRMRGWYDWNGTMPHSGVIPYYISIPTNPTREHWFGTTPSGTSLYFSAFGNDSRFGNYQLYIEANFNGYSARDFHLKKAYASWNDWTVGYANSSFSDPAAQPITVDGQGPNCEISDTNVLIRWMRTFKNRYVVALSMETPDGSIPTADNLYTGCSDYMPNFAGFLQYQWGNGGEHIRLSGIVRGLEYRDLVKGVNHKVTGWGAHLSSIFRPFAPLTVYGTCVVGKGIASLTNDLQVAPLDLIGNPDDEGRMVAPLSFGWYGALQYNFTPAVYSTVVFSEQRFLPKYEKTAENETYKYGLYVAANVFWEITPRCKAGLEYNWAQRKDIDNRHDQINRVSLVGQISF